MMLRVAFFLAKKLAVLLGAFAGKNRSSLLGRIATYVDYRIFEFFVLNATRLPKLNPNASHILYILQRDGICIIPDFWSTDKCILARAEVDRIIKNYPEFIHPAAKSDVRIFGVDTVSEIFHEFNGDIELMDIASSYNNEPSRAAFTLAARLPYTKNNNGSGEGWHRDAFLRQFKAILYLSDVGEDNGPFQMIRNSHRLNHIMNDMKIGLLGYDQSRIDNHQVNLLIKDSQDRLITCTGLAGTLILVDTSCIHRGKPIQTGTRYALTNYYYPNHRINHSMFERFRVIKRER